MAAEFLKTVFGDKQMSFDEFSKALESSKDIKIANLAEGKYVDKQKFDDKSKEVDTANNTIAELQAAVKKFDGVDVDALKTQISNLQTKYDNDTSSLKLNSALELALIGAKAKNPKLAKAAIDMSLIKLDGEKVLGLDEQLTKLKESDSYLFDSDDGKGGGDGKGGNGDNGGGAAGRAGSGAGHDGNGSGDDDDLSDNDYYAKVFKKE